MNPKFLSPLLGLVIGIFISSELAEGIWLGCFLISFSILIWLFITILSKDPLKGLKLAPFHSVWILFLFAGIGSLDFNFSSLPYLEKGIDGEKVSIEGKIVEVSNLANGDNFKVKIISLEDSINKIKSTNLKFLVKTDGFTGEKGDIISFVASPKIINHYGNRKGYPERMRHQGILYYANVRTGNINKIGENLTPIDHLAKSRNYFISLLEKSSLNRNTSEFLISIILGDKSFLSPEEKLILTSAGLAHALALSGLHIAIIYAIILSLLFPLSLLGYNKSRKIIAIILVWGFVLLTGCSPSAVRAALMATFIVGAYLFERKNSAFNGLLAATLIILIFNPLALWNPGLLLSFFSVAAIILFTNRLNPIERHVHPWLYKTVNLFTVTLVATLCTWIITSYYFRAVPLLFLGSNILLLPLLPFFIGSGIFYLIFLTTGNDISFFAKGLDLFHDFYIGAADFLSFGGKSTINLNIPFVSVVLWIFGMLLFAFVLHSNYRNIKKTCALLSIFSFLTSLAIIIIVPDKSSSLRFKHSYTKIEVEHLNDIAKTTLLFPRKNISKSETKEFEILSIDNIIHPDSIESFKKFSPLKPRYLLVGSGSKTSQIADLINDSDFSKVILHAGYGKNKKMELLHLLEESCWDKVYSLRDYGSLELDL